MSLDQLPAELIAHIGSFLHFDDNLQFGLSQKRVHNVLKRDGLDKPECDELVFEDTFYYYNLPGFKSPNVCYAQAVSDNKYNSVQGEFINKFRSIDKVHFDNANPIGEDVLKDILKTKVNFRDFRIDFVEIIFEDVDLFVAVCKKFEYVILFMPDMPAEFYNDKIFWNDYSMVNGYGLTDRTLEALTFPKVFEEFRMNRVFTSFTIQGIKNVVEKVVEAEIFDAQLTLGTIKFEEEWKANRWMEETNSNPDSPYVIRLNDPFSDPENMIHYAISLKGCTLDHRSCIRFSVNPVKV